MRLIKILFLSTLIVVSLSARKEVNISFSELKVIDFIKFVSLIVNKNILISHKIAGTVDFISSAPVYEDELMGILLIVLESKGFTLIEQGSVLELVRSADASKHNTKIIQEGQNVPNSFMVTQVIKLKIENVDIIASKIKHLISKTAKLVTIKKSNTILITDYPDNIRTVRKVIDTLVRKNNPIIKMFDIKYMEVKKLKKYLLDMSKTLFNDKIPSDKVKIIVNENANGLIVIGNKDNTSILENLIKKLDIKSNQNRGVRILSLKNSDAKIVLKSLTDIISKQVYKDPSLKPNVSANEEINAILVIGEPSVVNDLQLIIDELDKEKYQVYVKARIIEINQANSEELGFKYGFDGAKLSGAGLYSLSTNFGGSSAVGNTLGLTTFLTAEGLTGGFALGAALDFLETNSASKNISNPSILCVNNKESSIYVGKTISVSTGSVSSTTTGIGITNSYKREDVGLTLKIKPRVSSSDKVTLDIEAILENIIDDGSKNQSGQPITTKQEVKTQAILRHGENIIIGGLVRVSEKEVISKIPFFGAIPILGDLLFSSKSIFTEKDNLVVILTPYIIDKSEKLSLLQKDLGVMKKLQKEYNLDAFKRMDEKAKKIENSKEKDEEEDKEVNLFDDENY